MRTLIINTLALIRDVLGLVLGLGLACVPFLMGIIWGCMATGFDLGYSLTYHDSRRR